MKRNDIQVLRAIAVLLVVVYHLRSSLIPGGFVGVDVFFVISGYLITGSLVSEAERSGTIRLRAFWARRVRRLLPAATVVLAFVIVGMTALLPLAQWPTVIGQVVASALSAQNWVLASQSVDYLQASASATPVQHFWSLSVEEQFYAVWPFLLLGALALSRRAGLVTITVWRVVVGTLIGAFLLWSIVETTVSPNTAYFSTATRAWELLLGAALVLWRPRVGPGTALASGLLVAGVAMITASALLINGSTPFPGVAALVPTVGALLVIASGLGALRARPIEKLLALRPLVWVGDISYSLYLWHWPIIVFLLTFLPAETRLTAGLAAIALVLSFGLAWLSTRYLETPLQHPRRAATTLGTRRTFLLAGALLAATAVFVGGASLNFVRITDAARALADPLNYPGGRVLDPHFDASRWNDVVAPPIPDAAERLTIERQLTADCLTPTQSAAITSCEAGVHDSDTLVVLVGDSHAGQWLPAIDEIAQENNWHVIFLGKQYCTMTTEQKLYSIDQPGVIIEACVEWNREIPGLLLDMKPDLIIQGSLSYGYPEWLDEPHAQYDAERARSMAAAWQPLLAAGIPVTAIREVPRFAHRVDECMDERDATIDGCSEPLAPLLESRPSWLALAAQFEPRVPIIDMTPGLCPDGVCRPVIGNVLTYRDDSHVSAPFALSLTWLMREQLRASHPELFSE